MSKRRSKTGGYSASKKTYSPTRSPARTPRGTSGGSGVRSGVRRTDSRGSGKTRPENG